MNILVACEESQIVTKQLRKLGHIAYSCDIEPCSGGHPEWHLQMDVACILHLDWDMIIAHPPCTYLSNAGARHLWRNHELNIKRYKMGLRAKEFFMMIYGAKCGKIAIENPIPSKVYELPQYSQIIQPYEFGHPFMKRTCLWLKGLPNLVATEIIPPKERERVQDGPGTGLTGVGGKDRGIELKHFLVSPKPWQNSGQERQVIEIVIQRIR